MEQLLKIKKRSQSVKTLALFFAFYYKNEGKKKELA